MKNKKPKQDYTTTISNFCKRKKVWELFSPDKCISLTTYDPVKYEKDKANKFNKKIKEWHNMVVSGLVNGLSHTHRDGRINDINWVRKRGSLFEAFGRCMFDYHNEQDYESNERELLEISKEGYKLTT